VQGNATEYPGSTYPHDWLRTQSNALEFDGVNQYATTSIPPIDGVAGDLTFYGECWIFAESGHDGTRRSLCEFSNDVNSEGYKSGTIAIESDDQLSIGFGDNLKITTAGLYDRWIKISWECYVQSPTGDNIFATVDGVDYSYRESAQYLYAGAASTLNVGTYRLASSRFWPGGISNISANGQRIPLAEGAGDVAYNTDGTNHATLVNSPTWVQADGIPSSNLDDGFSLYEHASLDPIRVPYGDDGNPITITPPTGYTLTKHWPAVAGYVNNWEGILDFRIADDGEMPPAVFLADPTLPDTYAYGDAQTTNFRFTIDENGNTGLFLAFAEEPNTACLEAIAEYHDYVSGDTFPLTFPYIL
jgi:hypothetical protein